MKRFLLFALVATLFAACSTATLEMPIPSNQIWYTSSNGKIVKPYETDDFGANITSNTYENGVGVITFDGDVTAIGYMAFYDCSALTSVTIPDSVTSIGYYAFRNCDALKEVYCHSTTPPIAIRIDPKWSAFNGNASGRKIYVPTASVDAYKAADGWSEYADAIEPYNFAE